MPKHSERVCGNMAKKNINFIREEFKSLTDFRETILARPANSVFENASMTSDRKESAEDSWTGTESYADAEKIALSGYTDGMKGLTANTGARARVLGRMEKAMPTVGVEGFSPHVPNAIAGNPYSMITTTTREQKAKVVTILYYQGDSSSISAKAFIKAGKKLLKIISSLETQGYRVGLRIMNMFCQPKEYTMVTVQIKHWRHPSNPLKMAYPLIHPSFFRRHCFRWLETVEGLTDTEFPDGYGRPLRCSVGRDDHYGTPARREWLGEHGALGQDMYYTEFREVEQYSEDEIVKNMGLTGIKI